MRTLIVLFWCLLCLGPAQAQLHWLEGHWVNEESEEVWSSHKGDSMLGYHRKVEGDKTVFWEFLKLTINEQEATYWALPSGQSAVKFEMEEWAENWALFVNRANDFPTHIRYQRDGDTLTVTISGQGRESQWQFQALSSVPKGQGD